MVKKYFMELEDRELKDREKEKIKREIIMAKR